MWGEAQRLIAAAMIESGQSRDGDARAAWALGPQFSGLSLPIRAALLAARVRGLIDLGMPAAALQTAEEAVDIATRSGALDATLRALDARLFALLHSNEVSRAIEAGMQLIDAAENAGDVVLATRGRCNTGSVLNHVGMFELAQPMLERALHDARARRMRILEAFALHNVGMSYARQGNLDDGIAYERQAARIADECGAARLRIHTRVYETVMLVWRGAPGDLGTALTLARYVESETRSHTALYPEALFALSRVQLARRVLDGALESASEANRRLEAGPIEEWDDFIRLTLIEVLTACGRQQEADAYLERAFHAVVDRARAITRPDHRAAFLGRNEEINRILELARDRLGRAFQEG
jgi:tetratricopeptide (TPR) repeat protein